MLSDLAFVCLHHPHPFPPTPPSHTKASFTTTSATVSRCWENNHLQHPDWWQVYDQGHCHHCWIWHQDTTKGCKWPTLKWTQEGLLQPLKWLLRSSCIMLKIKDFSDENRGKLKMVCLQTFELVLRTAEVSRMVTMTIYDMYTHTYQHTEGNNTIGQQSEWTIWLSHHWERITQYQHYWDMYMYKSWNGGSPRSPKMPVKLNIQIPIFLHV